MRTNYTVDDEGNYSIQYLIPGYEPMTLEESQAFLSDYKMYPEWFIEGTANLVSGFYRFNYSKDLFDRAGTSDGSRIIFSEESVRAQYDTEIKMLTASSYDTENQDKFYCYAPLAVMYLSDRHLRSSGKQSALKYDENGVVTDVDVTALRESLSDIFNTP